MNGVRVGSGWAGCSWREKSGKGKKLSAHLFMMKTHSLVCLFFFGFVFIWSSEILAADLAKKKKKKIYKWVDTNM